MDIRRTSRAPKPPEPSEPSEPPTTQPPEPPDVDVLAMAAGLVWLSYAQPGAVARELARKEATRTVLLRAPAPHPFAPGVGRSPQMGLATLWAGRLWIVFRGSDDGPDWARNFSYLPFWHFGFRADWAALEAATLEAAAALAPDAPGGIVVAGHSLGGAIAIHGAAALSEAGHDIDQVVTFGAPRVGSPGFASRWSDRTAGRGDRRLGEVLMRITHPDDIVPMVPPALMGFAHVGPGTAHDPAMPKRLPLEIGLAFGAVGVLVLALAHVGPGIRGHLRDSYRALFDGRVPEFEVADDEWDAGPVGSPWGFVLPLLCNLPWLVGAVWLVGQMI